jgi:cation diffusion facilitator CzcD-associated flavoprotein CzcO
VVIVGAGFGGIGMALALRRAGIEDFLVLERADDVGGVWRDNTYPGAACDVPSSLYSYSFAPNRTWPRRYAGQADILDYLKRTAAPVMGRVRTRAGVTGARHRDGRWEVRTERGVIEADVLVSAVGQLSTPAVPLLAGVERFAGPVFHSARWRHDVDLRGKRVAVVGTGASAVQFVPHVQKQARRLTVFQRTAAHVVPKPDAAFRRSATRRGGRLATWLIGEALSAALDSRHVGAVEAVAAAHLRLRVRDPALRAKLTPRIRAGCKRLLFSNDWYPALASPTTAVVTQPISEVTAQGVRTSDGVEHPADVLVYGTGFAATDFLTSLPIAGLAEAWADGARAHLGITVPGFPNLFLVYGPNTNLGGNSIITMIEAQCRYIASVLRATPAGARVEVRPEVADAFDTEMRVRLDRSVWATCDSWYRQGDGRITTNWPGLVWEYTRRVRRPDPRDFRVVT